MTISDFDDELWTLCTLEMIWQAGPGRPYGAFHQPEDDDAERRVVVGAELVLEVVEQVVLLQPFGELLVLQRQEARDKPLRGLYVVGAEIPVITP